MITSSSNNNNDSQAAYVLYVDHQGHPAPLTECFHATASRRLSSTIDRMHRPSTITQVDSAYCPQCLTYHDVVTASELGYCPKVTCKRCPICLSVASIEESDSKKKYYYYRCGGNQGCLWNSKESLFGKSVEELDKKQRSMLAMSSMGSTSTSSSTDTNPCSHHYKTMIETWEKEVLKKKSKLTSRTSSTSSISSNTKGGGKKVGGLSILPVPSEQGNNDTANSWSLEELEKSIQQKRLNYYGGIGNDNNTIGKAIKLQRIKLMEDDDDKQHQDAHHHHHHHHHPHQHLDSATFENQLVMTLMLSALTRPTSISAATNTPGTSSSSSTGPSTGSATGNATMNYHTYHYQKPLPIPLRARKSRRCRAELAEGRPGILIKPKLNPLEGDSSLRTGHGQWWKKDSSAIHVIPRIKVLQTFPFRQETIFLVNVTNPTLGMVKLRLNPISMYTGERVWEPSFTTAMMTGATTASGTNTTTPLTTTQFENLLIDSMSNQKVNAQLQLFHNKSSSSTTMPSSSPPPTPSSPTPATTTNTNNATPTVELDSAEDAFVDLGRSKKMPPEVLQWIETMKQKQQTEHEQQQEQQEQQQEEDIKIHLITPQTPDYKSSSGIAWFELIVPTTKTKMESTTDSQEVDQFSSWWNAVAIAMQIQVGNGSWEASLIKTKTNTKGKDTPPTPTTPTSTSTSTDATKNEPDWVTLDLLLTWPSSSSSSSPSSSPSQEEEESEEKEEEKEQDATT